MCYYCMYCGDFVDHCVFKEKCGVFKILTKTDKSNLKRGASGLPRANNFAIAFQEIKDHGINLDKNSSHYALKACVGCGAQKTLQQLK